MTATTDTASDETGSHPTASIELPSNPPVERPSGALDRAGGVELLGSVHGSGYKEGAALVRRADGQMVQLGPLMYALLEAVDGRRSDSEVARAMSAQLGRRVEEAHVTRLAEKLAAQGLLAGTEDQAPPRRNPLLALRWKVLVTKPTLTRRLTAPFTIFFRPWIMWPVLAAFVAVCWFVLIHKGVASATAEAFHSPGLLLLVFALAVVSAGIHEMGHAAACRYGGATPGGMGMGLYLVWPAFYTDVTDAYRLDRRSRLRVDLAGLYFNAVVAVATMAVWLVVRVDALLLLVALQLLQMLKQLSPVIRADGYHILSDATGVPDLYAHMGPTLRRLLPGHRREPSALTGKARLLVTLWVLVVVPVLMSLMLSAVLLLPRLAASAWDSGRRIALDIPHQAARGDLIGVLASVLQLLALLLPVVGSALITQKFVRTMAGKARSWSRGRPGRRLVVLVGAAGVIGLLAWAWWPSGQYQPVKASDRGTMASLVDMLRYPASEVRPTAAPAPPRIAPGRYLALAMVPIDGATQSHPAFFVIPGAKGQDPVAIVSDSIPAGSADATGSADPAGATSLSDGQTSEPPSNTDPGGTAISSGGAPTTVAPGSIPPAAGTAGSGGTSAGGAGPSSAPTQRTTVIEGPGGQRTTMLSGGTSSGRRQFDAAAFSFTLPSAPGPEGTQAKAINTRNGGVTYDVAYALVTVTGGAPVKETNSAYALASCQSCTTVAVSFQLVLVVGQSKIITPANAAGALNDDCPACTTTAIADQMVLTLKAQPSPALEQQLDATLQQLDMLPELGSNGTPAAVATLVGTVQQQLQTELDNSGLLVTTTTTSSTTTTSTPSTTSTTYGSDNSSSTTTSTTVAGGTTSSGNTGGDVQGSGSSSSSTSTSTTSTSSQSSTSTTSTSSTTTTSTSSTTTTTTTTTAQDSGSGGTTTTTYAS